MTKYDIIGDIHGCATELKTLLAQLGYRCDDAGVYRHPERTAVFVGDLVDRGPDQLEVLQIVKAMVDHGGAQIVMGNHEFNAICYAMGLREQTKDNYEQHKEFLRIPKIQRELYIEWFRTIPLWLELPGPDKGSKIRVVHACWHEESMQVVLDATAGSDRLTEDQHFVDAMAKKEEHPLYKAVETLLKGPEIDLLKYGQQPFHDRSMKARHEARLRWWKPDARTLSEIADVRKMQTVDGDEYPPLPDTPVDVEHLGHTYDGTIPVIYGHYSLDWDKHQDDCSSYTACVDFNGKLVAYRWHGEATISPRNYEPYTDDLVAEPRSG